MRAAARNRWRSSARSRRPGSSDADLPWPPTRTGFSTLIARRGASCSTMPGALDEKDERRGAAVHRRHFRPVELDHGVVDLEPGKGRHQMLDGRDGDASPCDGGAQRRVGEVAPGRGDLARPTSLRRKRMPVSAAAGCRVMPIRTPECRPTPRHRIAALRVFCRAAPLSSSASSTVARCDRSSMAQA